MIFGPCACAVLNSDVEKKCHCVDGLNEHFFNDPMPFCDANNKKDEFNLFFFGSSIS